MKRSTRERIFWASLGLTLLGALFLGFSPALYPGKTTAELWRVIWPAACLEAVFACGVLLGGVNTEDLKN